jgi:hypothetical protein
MKPEGKDARQMTLDLSRSTSTSPTPPQEQRAEDHARRIAGFLSMALPCAVDVVFHENRRTMISYKRAQGRLVVRLHRMFRHAGGDELTALALFLKGRDPGASRALDRFIAEHRAEISAIRKRRATARVSAGATHDLVPVLEGIRQRYFGGLGDVAICWTSAREKPAGRRRSRSRSRALATYSFEDRTIRVSKVLDSPRVPEFVLGWIVYHEMLHHVLPYETESGRRRFHTRRFRALERAYERYDEAREWEKANLDWLLA